MFDEQSQQTFETSRRQFVGGVTSLLAASAFSLTMPEDAAAQVTEGGR